MSSGYQVLPLTTDGDVYALYDPKGNQVAMGTREVCQALLHLVTHSPLMERPPRHYEQVAPQRRPGAADGARVSDSVGRPKGPPPPGRGFESREAEEAAPGLPQAAERRLTGAHPAVPLERSYSEAGAEPYGILELIYLGGRSVASHWYVSLPVVIVIGSALLMWSLFPNG